MLALLHRFRVIVATVAYLLVALVLLLGNRDAEPGQFGAFAGMSMQLTTAGQSLAAGGLAGAGNFWERYVRLVGVKEENERLRAEVDMLREQNARLLGVMQENARLRSMVGFAEDNPDFELIPARVVGRDLSPYFRVNALRLVRPDPRVQPGLPVVSSAGLVGTIAEVERGSALVRLSVDPRSAIDVVVQRNRARGILHGRGHENDYRAEVAYLLRREEVREGDLVVTSGVASRIPPDLVVGRIERVHRQTHGMFQEVDVEPAVDFSRLEEVYVLVESSRALP